MKVYGLMITGEPKRGNEFAYMAATNFRQQTHQDLELIIVNHSPNSIAKKFDNPSCINEVMVENNYTLGDLRNIALDQVPNGSWWVQWDDDDWHAETSIAKQLEFTISGNFIASLQCNMIYYDLRSDRAWQTHMCGIPATIMTTKTEHRYLPLQSGEDTFFIWSVGQVGFKLSDKIGLLENNPGEFIRCVHGSNTCIIHHPADQKNQEWRVPYKSMLSLRKTAPLLQKAYLARSESEHA